jgi:hypothetical protein
MLNFMQNGVRKLGMRILVVCDCEETYQRVRYVLGQHGFFIFLHDPSFQSDMAEDYLNMHCQLIMFISVPYYRLRIDPLLAAFKSRCSDARTMLLLTHFEDVSIDAVRDFHISNIIKLPCSFTELLEEIDHPRTFNQLRLRFLLE